MVETASAPLSSAIAAKATFALNAGECFHRDRFAIP